jgi:peptide deformylase
MKNLFLTVEKTEKTEVNQSDIDNFNNLVEEMKTELEYLVGVTAPHIGIKQRIIRYNDLTLVNPVIIEKRDPLVYVESDMTKPNKLRKVLRYSYIKVNTDNLGVVEFMADKSNWKSLDVMLSDSGLAEACVVQRMMDSLDGIHNTSKTRRYDASERSQKIPRNQKVMLQSPSGDMIFIKYKLADTYMSNGYKLM